MANETTGQQPAVTNLGWRVTFAGMGVNLALGILYSWSVISKKIPDEWAWTEAQKSLPYSIACLIFSLIMVPAGRLQDRIGPRVIATAGGVLVGIGFLLASFTTSVAGYILGFGVLAGIGIGCGYAATTPPAVKWFPASRTGLVTGIVVAGFGLSGVYAAPLANGMIGAYGLPKTMLILGIGFFVVVVGLSQLIKIPPTDYVPVGPGKKPAGSSVSKPDSTPMEVLKTWQFYLLWFMYACGAGAGLMIISKLVKLVEVQAGLKLGFLLVAVLAIGNGTGRILAGIVSDKIGRKATLFACFMMQAVFIITLSQAKADSPLGNSIVMALLSAFIGANYGANLSLFPSIAKDYYGLKNFGVNYGLLFTAWGLGGFTLSLLAGAVYDKTHTFTFAYYCSAGLLLAAAAASFVLSPPRKKT